MAENQTTTAGGTGVSVSPAAACTIVVEIMPKPEILDPQGRAVATVLRRDEGGPFAEAVTQIRVGKRFEIQLERPATEADLQSARLLATRLLANTVIEDVVAVTAALP